MSTNQEGQEGFSLVEMMIAVVAIVAVLGAILMGTVRNSSQRQQNAEINLATLAVMDTFEELRSLDETQLVALDGTGFDVPDVNGASGGLRPLNGDSDGLPGELRVTPHLTVGAATLYRVTATVVWTGTQRVNRVSYDQLMRERK